MTKIKKHNIAVVGFGQWGRNLVRNFYNLEALKIVCDKSIDNLDLCQKRFPQISTVNSFENLLAKKEIDAVVIASPAEQHEEMVEKALLAGKDVFVEKPLSLTLKSGQKLVELAKSEKRVLMVGHLLWYHPAILKLKELVQKDELGPIRYIYSNRLNLGKIRREENILWSFAPHDLSVILGLINEMPSTVTAQGGNYLNKNIADVTVSCLGFPSGKRAHIFVSWLHPFKEQKLIVIGEKKMAVFNDIEKEKKLLLYPHTIEWKGDIPIVSKALADVVPIANTEPLRAECEHFLDCIQTRKQPRTNGEEALRVLSVLQDCQQALEKQTSNLLA